MQFNYEPGDITPKKVAEVYAKHTTNERGEILARVWESPEFKEAHDYNQGHEKKGLLKMKLESVYRHTNLTKMAFQKVYYNPALTLDDEIELRNRFIVESGSHDLREKIINWSTFLGYWPALYLVSRKFNGWGVVLTVTGAWYLLYRQLNRFNNSMLQTNLNTFASPLVSKYKIVNHHD